MKTFLPIVLSIILHHVCYCQTKIPKEFKKAVAFIYVQDSSGKIIPNGTGFFIAINEDSLVGQFYLITAKHVLKKQNGTFYNKIFLRLPLRKDSTLQQVQINLSYNKPNGNTYFHSDTTVDIAAISGMPKQRLYDYLTLSSDFLTTKHDFDSLNIIEGDEVFFTGLFGQYIGEKANYPITRFGRVSLITNEKVFWNGNFRNLYLLEATTYWGNSGSPVYFALQRRPVQRPGMIITGTETVFKLAGIMNGFFGDGIPIGFAETSLHPYQLVNFGISAVTPSYLLWELLYSDELKKARGF